MTTHERLDTGDWLACCDGGRLIVFENVGTAEAPALKPRMERQHEGVPTRAMGTDRPGRAYSSDGTVRSAVEGTDFHDADERAFLGEVASLLSKAAEAGDMPAIIVVAPPRALGYLRDHYGRRLKERLRGEVAADLVHAPVRDLEARFRTAPRT